MLIHSPLGYVDLRDAEAARVHDVGIARVGEDGAPFPTGHRLPIDRRNGAQIAATGCRDRARVLLRRVNPVRERIVGGDMITCSVDWLYHELQVSPPSNDTIAPWS